MDARAAGSLKRLPVPRRPFDIGLALRRVVRPLPKAAMFALAEEGTTKRAWSRPDGELPCDAAVLLALPGVGPRCAHLALGIACGERRISVDIQVHRVTNRWG